MSELFQPVELVSEATAPENRFPFYILAYYHHYWKLHPESYSAADAPVLLDKIKSLREKGWCHIRVIKVP